ncbi:MULTISPECIES: endonuclease V [Priestia]|uniref:endonuclease V n=1 Tax=Priestia TaxID=2800373 RepID=UPI0003F88D42|nr:MULTISPECIES: endonuclease V [Priestia]ANF46521.1 endonuclease V [Priestia megaterium]AQU74230.1 endonuclease V [Priestia megaterium]MCU7763799.1 endonuclease V [Priestia megaterium]
MNIGNMKEKFSEIQSELLGRVNLENNFNKENISTVGGVDIAYWNRNEVSYGTCSIVIIDLKTKEIIETVYSYGKVAVPYMPGFLAFRELPLILKAAEKLKIIPDLYMFDGNGYLHYCHMGIATHASFFLDKPTIGVAKSYLKINNVDFTMPENIKGAYTDIIIDKEVYGRTLRTRKGVKPIFVSCGNWIDLDTSIEIVMKCVNDESRLPIPVRLADLETHKMRKQLSQ